MTDFIQHAYLTYRNLNNHTYQCAIVCGAWYETHFGKPFFSGYNRTILVSTEELLVTWKSHLKNITYIVL